MAAVDPSTTRSAPSAEELRSRAGSGPRSDSGSGLVRELLAGLGSGLLSLLKRPFYTLYEKRLEAAMKHWALPRHIGIIMDGNRRFARASGSAHVSWGHARGADKLQQVLSWCYEADIPVVTVWSFSLDNFHRDTTEVEALLDLFESKTRELAQRSEVHENGVRVRYIGKLSLLPESLQEAIRAVEEATAGYDRFHLNIAMAYGGREEITDAFKSFLEDRRDPSDAAGGLDRAIAELDDEAIEKYLYTSGLPEPDLIVRTSGEVRMSGFLLWQSAYSEFYFCDTHWPAFRRIDFLRALRSHHQRQRRYGR
jgi:short-chain Z-isoprenyl diphosphate synthase